MDITNLLPEHKKQFCRACFEICGGHCVIFRDAEKIYNDLKEKQAALKTALNNPELIFTQYAEISAELNDVELKLQGVTV